MLDVGACAITLYVICRAGRASFIASGDIPNRPNG